MEKKEAFCDYNSVGNCYWCQVIWGYCQFQTDPSIHECPIRLAYPYFYEYWLNQATKDGLPAKVENISTLPYDNTPFDDIDDKQNEVIDCLNIWVDLDDDEEK